MRILFDYQAFALQQYGGVSRCFAELYKHLPKEVDAQISLYESDNVYVKDMINGLRPKGYKYKHFICNLDFRGKGHLHLWYDKLTRGHYYPDYNQYCTIETMKEGNYDVFHPTYFNDYFLPYLNGKPFVLTIHDMIPELYPQYFRRDDFQIRMRRKLASLASSIVAVSENTKQDVIRLLHVPEEKVHVVYHGCSFPMVNDILPIFPFPYILYVGARWSYKNFIAFVRNIVTILNKHQDIQVVCTGKPFTNEELSLFEKLQLQNRFVHQWVKEDAELFSLYHHAVCFVYPSEYEGFGIPILEAYKANCPVMLNHASCFPEIAGDAAIYFTMTHHHSDFAEQLEKLLSMSSEEKEALLSKQRKRLARFSWEKSAQKLAQVYQSIV